MSYLLNDYNIQVCDNIIDFAKFIKAHNETDKRQYSERRFFTFKQHRPD